MIAKVPVFSIEEQEELDRLIHEKDSCNLVLFLNKHISDEASLETMVLGVQRYMPYLRLSLQETDIDRILDVIGTASLLNQDFEQAFAYFKEANNVERIEQTLRLGILYGNWKVVKQINDYGKEKTISRLTLSDVAYREFFRLKALPFIQMLRDDNGFFFKEDNLESILEVVQPESREGLFGEVLETLDINGSLNVAKKYIFALLTKDQTTIKRYQELFERVQKGSRPVCDRIIGEYLAGRGRVLKVLQNGDNDNFFPRSGNIFLVEEDEEVYVAKEHLKQYTDFSRINGYSTEKEILELGLDHPGLPKYLDSFKTGGIEFLKIEFVKGDPLRRFVKQRLPKAEVIDVLIQTADIIEYLQSQNIIYGDLKDKNLIYDGQKITLIDFGMSRRFDKPINDQTFYFSTASTPKYTTPERIMMHRIYAKSDVFQLGILAYELLTGEHPFARYDFKEGKWFRSSSLIKYGLSNLHNRFVPNKKISEDQELCSLIGQMLSKEIDQRPSIIEVKERLEQISERSQESPIRNCFYARYNDSIEISKTSDS